MDMPQRSNSVKQEEQFKQMEKVKILIVEDQMIIAADIAMFLESIGYEIAGILPKGEDALTSISQTPPDIILMDIALKGTMDGIQTARYIFEKYQIPVIFLTANADDATFERAKSSRPYAFISKPFQPTDLQRAIELALARIAEEQSGQSMMHLNNSQNQAYILADRIFVRHKGKMTKILLQDILFVEASRSYCKIVTTEAEFLMSIALGRLEEKLEGNHFQRIHRSHVVNIKKIDSISDDKGYLNIGGHQLSISKHFKDELMRRLQIF
jgi:DNA-binding LytR/AlgR family response regulator